MEIILKKGQWCNKHGTPINEDEKKLIKSIIQNELGKNLSNNQFNKSVKLFILQFLK